MAEWDNLMILADQASMARYSAERIVRMANTTLEYNDVFSIALSGGSTPKPVYEMLGTMFARFVDWSRVHLWWGDERAVAPDDERSNYHMAQEALLNHIDIPPQNVHRMRGEDDPDRAAILYQAELQEFFANDKQLFDLCLLGMGEDGHTASLFPGTTIVHEQERWVVAQHVEAKGNLWRISLTPPAILKSANIMFLVSGNSKAKALQAVLAANYQIDKYPSQIIARSEHKHILWVVDEAAASQLS